MATTKVPENIEGEVWIICECGEKHPLKPGVEAPYYWCGDELKKLVAGDTVEYKEQSPSLGSSL